MDGRSPDPRGQTCDRCDNNYRRGEFDLPTPGQQQLENPKFAASPRAPSKKHATKNKYGHEPPKKVIPIYNSSEDEYKEDPVEVWALRQHRAGNKDHKFLSSSRAECRSMMNGVGQKPKCSSWPPHPPRQKLLQSLGSELLQCDICGRQGYGLWCDHKDTPQTTPTDNNNNITPVKGTTHETIYIDDGALPYYEYSETTTTEDGNPLYLESDCSDDDGHRECGLEGYKNCPDDPTNYPTTQYRKNNKPS